LEIDDFLEVYVPLNLKYWKLYRNEKVSKEALRYERLKKSFDAINYDVSDALIDTLATAYIDNLSSFNHLFEGAIELLDYLKEKYKLHIITNGFEEVQSKKMINSKLFPYFDQIITSESVGVKKPDARVFNYALGVSKSRKENSIMIGDSLEADIHGALNIGMHAIHCVFDGNTPKDEKITSVTSLLEIKQYL
jgi:putative hydrolase of the HAD superfamily